MVGSRGNSNSYAACYGTTTFDPVSATTGLFAFYSTYLMSSVTDGTSNTIAFSEVLVGDGGPGFGAITPTASQYRGNVVVAATAAPGSQVLDANTNIPAVLAGLQNCAMGSSKAGRRSRPSAGSAGRWA